MTERRVHVPEALDGPTLSAFECALEGALTDPHARVVVLEGGDEVFCHGMALAGLLGERTPEEGVRRFAACLERLATGPKPVIAVVRGAATGGGVGIAAACDLVIASPGATFALPELLFGLLPAVIAPYLGQRVSPARLRLWALGAAGVSARAARQAGLVDVVTEGPRLGQEVGSWARRLGRLPAEAVSLWKRQMGTAAAAAAACAVWTTNDRLRDAVVRGRVRRFMEDGEAPWRH